MKKIGVRDFRSNIKKYVSETFRSDEIFFITSNDIELAAVVPVEYAQQIQKMISKERENEKAEELSSANG